MSYFDDPLVKQQKEKLDAKLGPPRTSGGLLDLDAITDDTPSIAPSLLPLMLRVQRWLEAEHPTSKRGDVLEALSIDSLEFTTLTATVLGMYMQTRGVQKDELLRLIQRYRAIPPAVTDLAFILFLMGREFGRREAEES